jgi:DNA-binding GntR family transcriptional regulator
MLDLCPQRDVTGACKLQRLHIQHAGESLKKVLEEKRVAAK